MLSLILLSIGLLSANLPYINTVTVDNQNDGKNKHNFSVLLILKSYKLKVNIPKYAEHFHCIFFVLFVLLCYIRFKRNT